MPTLNLQLNTVSYKDVKPSNNPSIRVFDLAFKQLGMSVERPKSEDFTIAPGETRSVFNGTRTTSIDGTTAFTLTRPNPNSTAYRFTNSAGTAPVLRTSRLPGVDNTSTFTVSINGPLSTYTNTGGTALDTTNIVVGDILKIENGAGFSQSNSGTFVVLNKSSNSITVQNLNAIVESITLTDFTKFYAYSNGGSNNQVQIGDKVVISAGFSPATQGTYVITDVTPSWFEIEAAPPNGLPLETGIIPGAAGIVFYSSAVKFVLIAAQQKCSVRFNADTSDNTLIEPNEVNNPERPGLCLKMGTSYSMSIKNLSLEPMNVIVATAE